MRVPQSSVCGIFRILPLLFQVHLFGLLRFLSDEKNVNSEFDSIFRFALMDNSSNVHKTTSYKKVAGNFPAVR
jgi:hypothetical protein